MKRQLFRLWMLALPAGILVGCSASHSPTTEPVAMAPATEPTTNATTQSVMSRWAQLSPIADDYAQLTTHLPGTSRAEYRQLMGETLDKLHQFISILSGPGATVSVSDDLQTIAANRDMVENTTSDVAVEPAVNTGLRSAYHAMLALAKDKDFADQDLTDVLAPLGNRLLGLDAVHGLDQETAASQAAVAASDVLKKMTKIISEQLPPEAVAAPLSHASSDVASQPATPPSSAPANP